MSTPTPPLTANIERNGGEEEEERSTATSTEKDGTHINIKVRGQADEDEVLYRVKRDVKLRRLMDMYWARQSIHRDEVRFVEPGAGRIIREEQTPDEVGLEDGDAILSLLYQSGS